MILLRTTSFSADTAAFATLIRDSGQQVCFVVDETRGVVDCGTFEKISLTRNTCEAAGLHCPHDFGWRCGDYGFYLARKRYPRERIFWQIEYDVRISGRDMGEFFKVFEGAEDVDLVAGHLREADDHWFWTHAMAAFGHEVWRCLFPVVRLSSSAIDLLYKMRLAYARKIVRRLGWPNDESFVATVLKRNHLICRDLNDFGVRLYGDDTFSFHYPFDGATLNETKKPLAVYHPVLFGKDLERKLARMAVINKGEPTGQKFRRRMIHAFNRRMAP